jgi:hypothetical protein
MSDPVRREQLLAKAVQQGKFPPSRVDHYRGLYEADPIGTEQLLAALEPGLLPGELESLQVQAGGGFPVVGGVPGGVPSTDDPFKTRFDPKAGTGRIFKAKDA